MKSSVGWYHSYFASTCIEEGICRVLIASESGVDIGTAVFYEALTKPFPTTVIYYVAVNSAFRGRGVGKALVASVESLFDDNSRVFLATTRESNTPSRRLFQGLGYNEVHIELLEGIVAEVIEKLTCSYEDDVVLFKGVKDIGVFAHFHENLIVAEKTWEKVCYEPWKRLRRP